MAEKLFLDMEIIQSRNVLCTISEKQDKIKFDVTGVLSRNVLYF